MEQNQTKSWTNTSDASEEVGLLGSNFPGRRLTWRESAQNSGIASEWLLYSTSCKIICVWVKWRTIDAFKLHFEKRTGIRKRCLNSGQIDVISVECFSLNRRRFCRGTQEASDVGRLCSKATQSLAGAVNTVLFAYERRFVGVLTHVWWRQLDIQGLQMWCRKQLWIRLLLQWNASLCKN